MDIASSSACPGSILGNHIPTTRTPYTYRGSATSEANWVEVEDERAVLQVSEVTKGQSSSDSVTVVVNDLGNFGEGEALEASAAWNIAILPQLVAPTVHVDGSSSPKDFLRTTEGTTLRLPVTEVSHDVMWETTHENDSSKLQYLIRLICSRGAAKPDLSVVGRGLVFMLPSATVTTLRGSLPDVNRALSHLDYYAPRWYRGVDTIEVVARVAGFGVEGGWGAAKLYMFVDGVNHPPDLTAPRAMRKTGAAESIVRGISVSDDDHGGVMTVTVEAARGLVAFPVPHRLQLLGEVEVRRRVNHAQQEFLWDVLKSEAVDYCFNSMLYPKIWSFCSARFRVDQKQPDFRFHAISEGRRTCCEVYPHFNVNIRTPCGSLCPVKKSMVFIYRPCRHKTPQSVIPAQDLDDSPLIFMLQSSRLNACHMNTGRERSQQQHRRVRPA